MSRAVTRRAFDYGSLPADQAKRLRQQTEKIRRQMQATVPIILEIGRDLIAVKETLDHGRFITWVEVEVGITRRTAQNYMSAARFAEGKSETVSLLNPAVLYRLSSKTTPPNIINDVITRTKSGTVSDAEITVMLTQARSQERQAERKAAETAREAQRERHRQLAHKRALEALKRDRQEAESWAAEQVNKQASTTTVDALAVLQRAWDAAPHETRRQFALANAIELRTFLALAPTTGAPGPLSKNAIAGKVDRAFARSQGSATTPAPSPDYPDLPDSLKRSTAKA